MRIAIGTRNPIKLIAARTVLTKAWSGIEIIPVDVSSGVSSQPATDEETITGAINRAREARCLARADIGIGLEGGLRVLSSKIFTSEWCAVVDQLDHVWLGGGSYVLLPTVVLKHLARGVELGQAIDQLTGLHSSKTGPGAVGVLTGGLIDRRRSYEVVISYALAALMSPQYYLSDELHSARQEYEKGAIRDSFGLLHPIEAVQGTLRNLKQQKEYIANASISRNKREELLYGIETAITVYESLTLQHRGASSPEEDS